jgi:AcrR family transcriptional regulator
MAKSAASAAGSSGSPRREELLSLAYDYVLERGLAGVSLRPLAAATGTSPRVLLYLFDSKDGLVRELLARARYQHLTLLSSTLSGVEIHGVDDLVHLIWRLLAAPEQRGLVRLTYEAFLMSLQHDPGPWTGFAEEQVSDWLAVLRSALPGVTARQSEALATRALAVVRGLLLDLLATGDTDRIARSLRHETL